MTADRRAALVEKVAKSLWSLQYLTPYETDANSSAKIEFRAIAEGLIDLNRAEVLEEAARVVEAEIDEAYTMEDRAKNAARRYAAAAIRALKGDT
jgi:hypothetical protein